MNDELDGRYWFAHHDAFGQWVNSLVATLAGLTSRRKADDPTTLLLTGRDIRGLMSEADWLHAVETGFQAAARGKAFSPPPLEIGGDDGAFHAKGASLMADRHYVALKFNGNFPSNPSSHGLPTIQGAILLCDGGKGTLLAIMDSIEVTLRRTAAATALAARFLSRSNARSVLICGCGEQGRAHLSALRAILPIERCLAWDIDPARAQRFAEEMRTPSLAIEAASDLPVTADADIVVTCTTSSRPFLSPSMVKAGTFVAAVGADSPQKNEIEPALMAKALIVTDVRDQCEIMGDLHHAIVAGLSRNHVHAELGELVSGTHPGRTADDEITLFDSTGTALEDVASAAMIYERARRSPVQGRSIALSGAG